MTDDLVVAGGIGGTRARLDDLTRAAAVIAVAAAHLGGVGLGVRRAAHALHEGSVEPDLAHAHALAVERVAWVDQGPGGATAVGHALEDTAANLCQTVRMLEDAEHHSGSLMAGVGRLWDKAWALGSFVVWVPLKITGAVTGTVVDGAEALGLDWGPGAWVLGFAGGVADVVNPDWVPNPAPLLYGDDLQDALAVAGVAWSVATLPERGLRWITGHGAPPGLVTRLSEGLGAVTSALDHILGDSRPLTVIPLAPRLTTAPAGVAGALGRLERLSPIGEDGPSSIAIERITHADGTQAWVVEIPGTQDWIPNGGANPIDFTSDLALMACGASDLTRGVEQAMQLAGIPPGDPVMIVGHSQGGIAAVGLVSSPTFAARYNVTTVLTAGAPVAGFDPPPGTKVLSLEHASDTVPALDGADNPDRPGWTTVRRDLAESDDAADRLADNQMKDRHDLPAYVRTGARVDGSLDPSIRDWNEGAADFLEPQGATTVRTVFEITRGADSLVIPRSTARGYAF